MLNALSGCLVWSVALERRFFQPHAVVSQRIYVEISRTSWFIGMKYGVFFGEIQMASENLQRWWPSLGSLDVPRCRKCRVPRVPRVPSSLPLCPLQIMPAPPNFALQLPHFGRVPSTTSTTTFKNIQRNSGQSQRPQLKMWMLWMFCLICSTCFIFFHMFSEQNVCKCWSIFAPDLESAPCGHQVRKPPRR